MTPPLEFPLELPLGYPLGTHLGICPICTEQVGSVLAELAWCGACSQPSHAACLHAALRNDSRCPLCREELATVGYTHDGLSCRPERRRLPGNNNEFFAFIRSIHHENTSIINSLQDLRTRVRELGSWEDSMAVRLRTPTTLKTDALALQQRIEALQERCNFSEEHGVPGDIIEQFRRTLSAELEVIDTIKKICQHVVAAKDLRRRINYLERMRRDAVANSESRSRAVQEAQQALDAARATTSAAAARKARLSSASSRQVLRRPSAAKRRVLVHRPAAAKQSLRRRPAAAKRVARPRAGTVKQVIRRRPAAAR